MNVPTEAEREEESRAQQAFIDSIGDLPDYQKTDFEPWVGKTFSVTGMAGEEKIELTLDDIESLKENVHKRRKNIRRFPFTLEFTAPDSFGRLVDGNYKLIPKTDPDVWFFLYVKGLDYLQAEEIIIYESVVN